MPEWIIISNDKIKGWSGFLDNAKKRAKEMAKQTGSGHSVYKYVTTYLGGSGRKSK